MTNRATLLGFVSKFSKIWYLEEVLASDYSMTDRSLLGRYFWGFVLPLLEYLLFGSVVLGCLYIP